MTERDLSRVNGWAGILANGSVERIKAEGIDNAVVWVTDGSAVDVPLSIRNTMNGGFWKDGLDNYKLFQQLAIQARKQAKYAMTDPGRDAEKQVEKLHKTYRSATSYSPAFSPDMQPGYTHSSRSGLTVVAVAPDVDVKRMVKLIKSATEDVDNDRKPRMMEAARFMHACYSVLEPKLAKLESDRPTGIAMLALPYFIEELATEFDPGPVVVAAQSVGRVVDVAKFDVVSAKALCVSDTGRPSGTLDGDQRYQRSNIKGAVRAQFDRANRVVAVGGLQMEEDVDVILEVEKGNVAKELGMQVDREY